MLLFGRDMKSVEESSSGCVALKLVLRDDWSVGLMFWMFCTGEAGVGGYKDW
jgi:hypothetical protein